MATTSPPTLVGRAGVHLKAIMAVLGRLDDWLVALWGRQLSWEARHSTPTPLVELVIGVSSS